MKKQTALKGLLFCALAANISWHPMFSELNSYDANSEVLAAPQGPVLRPQSRPTNSSTTNSNPLSISPNGVTVADDYKPIPGAVSYRSDSMNVCNVVLHLDFEELLIRERPTDPERMVTQIDVQPKTYGSSAVKPFKFRQRGDLASNSSEETRNEIYSIVDKEVRRQLGPNCETAAGNDSSSSNTGGRADRGRACSGMREDERLSCLIEEIATLQIVDPDNATERREALKKLEELFKPLKAAIKSRLVSDDEDRRYEGQDLLAETMAALEDLKSFGDFDLEDRRGRRGSKLDTMIGELQALDRGSQVLERGMGDAARVQDMGERVNTARDLYANFAMEQNELANRVTTLNASVSELNRTPLQQRDFAWQMQMQDAFMSLEETQQRLSRSRQQASSIQGSMNQLMSQRSSLMNQLQMGSQRAYGDLVRYRERGLITQSDFQAFTNPYTTSMEQLRSMSFNFNVSSTTTNSPVVTAPIALTDFTAPSDAASVRAGLTNYRPGTTVGIPQAPPSISLSDYGLSSTGGLAPLFTSIQ